MVQAGRFGRKAGQGYYDYASRSHRPDDPNPPGAAGDGVVAIDGDSQVAEDLWELAADAGFEPQRPDDLNGRAPRILIDARVGRLPEDGEVAPGSAACVLVAEGSLSELELGAEGAVG